MLELGRGDGPTEWVCGVFIALDLPVAMFPQEAQREVWTDTTTLIAPSSMPGSKTVALRNATLPVHRIVAFADSVTGDTPGGKVHEGAIYQAQFERCSRSVFPHP